ncbi:hypothetical protein [Arcicella lustrica]|uniref:Uncharacterized protein n=1 Tax=Arcicella lustrica TaxID=2984196 RepID=A0ABU5SD73_9BACT|nr:hypothetical protein [Arcicella sp. DC25W]MEA5425245.1 hypothetical protein [Arcicella sp. DC25W]
MKREIAHSPQKDFFSGFKKQWIAISGNNVEFLRIILPLSTDF